MSIVLLHPTKENTALCFVKGADSSVFPMCNNYSGPGKAAFSAAEGNQGPNNKIIDMEK